MAYGADVVTDEWKSYGVIPKDYKIEQMPRMKGLT